MIKQIKEIPRKGEHEKIDFKFKKKSGFNKLLILDLDETLIHTKYGDDELDFDRLVEWYGQDFMNVEPDEWVEMCSPDDPETFLSGFFVRPYL